MMKRDIGEVSIDPWPVLDECQRIIVVDNKISFPQKVKNTFKIRYS